MLPLDKIFQKRVEDIKKSAETEEKKALFLLNLIKSEYDKFYNYFYHNIESEFKEKIKDLTEEIEKKGLEEVKEEFSAERLYFHVSSMIHKLKIDILSEGIWIGEAESPDVMLNLSEYTPLFPDNPKSFARIKRLTEYGERIIEDYKKVIN